MRAIMLVGAIEPPEQAVAPTVQDQDAPTLRCEHWGCGGVVGVAYNAVAGYPTCMAHTQLFSAGVDRSGYWRAVVTRLAYRFLRTAPQEKLLQRICGSCRATQYADGYLFPPSEPVYCDHCLRPAQRFYRGHEPGPRQRDAYWYACCLTGRDPEAPSVRDDSRSPWTASPHITPERLGVLMAACFAVGLTFGSEAPRA